jgi:replicative DNA helicase
MKIELEDYVLNIISKQNDISNALRLRKEWFIKPVNKFLYEKIIEDKTTDIKLLGEKYNVDQNYILHISENIYAPINQFEDYKIQLEVTYKKMLVKNQMNEFVKSDFNLEQASSKLIELSELMKITVDTNNSIEEILPEHIEHLFTKHAKEQEKALYTNYELLDKCIHFLPKNTTIISASTGIGKTTFALNIFRNFILNNYSGVVYSLEMSKEEVLNKMISSISGVENNKLYRSNYQLQGVEKQRVEHASNLIDKSNCYIEDSFNMTIEDIKQDLRSKKLKSNIEFAFIDHIGLVGATEFKNDRRLSISHISRELKKVSKELEMHIFLIVQLNRQAEGNKANLSNLSESADLERDASNIMILERSRLGGDTETTSLSIQKVRQGKPCEISYRFNGDTSNVEELGEINND